MNRLTKGFGISIVALLALAACSKPGNEAAPVAESDQPAQVTPPRSADELMADNIEKVIAGSWRSPANKARDQYRHPKETLEFFGVNPGMNVIEITPGGGWYTEILAPLLKGSGHYHAAIAASASSDYAKRSNDALLAKLTSDPQDYGVVSVDEFDPKAPVLGAPGSADMVLTFRNVHNWVGSDTAPQMFKAFFDVLKAGGVLGVVDHRAAAGSDIGAIKNSGYLPQEFVTKLAMDAGFTLAAQSEINANPKDTKDYEQGVWTLPPTYRLNDKDRAKYAAIGESDRMTLKFVKPAGDAIFNPADAKPDDNKPVPATP